MNLMGEAIGQMLPFAVGVAISPMPIVAMVLMLITPKAKSSLWTGRVEWFEIVGVPGDVDPRFESAVEAKRWESTGVWKGPDPVGLRVGRFGTDETSTDPSSLT